MNIGKLHPHDPSYPAALLSAFGGLAGPYLSFMGNLELLAKPAVGFCGSRNASASGLSIAADCAAALALNGIVVSSGYARGIDCVAHIAALQYGGSTIIILPEGIRHFRIKADLAKFWDWKRILVISQFEETAIWRADRAMERNKLIVALSSATFVVEAGDKGGTLNAGMTALKMKRPLFVGLFSNYSDINAGNKKLLDLGALKIGRDPQSGKPNIAKIISYI